MLIPEIGILYLEKYNQAEIQIMWNKQLYIMK